MSDFRQLSETVWASPQITTGDVAVAASGGFALIVNNRPEGEAPDQTGGDAIAAAARDAGLAYVAIPISPGGFSMAEVDAMADALAGAKGPVLAYCRSGTRSTLLWSLAQAKLGRDPSTIAAAAMQAGYDISPVRQLVDQLSAAANG